MRSARRVEKCPIPIFSRTDGRADLRFRPLTCTSKSSYWSKFGRFLPPPSAQTDYGVISGFYRTARFSASLRSIFFIFSPGHGADVTRHRRKFGRLNTTASRVFKRWRFWAFLTPSVRTPPGSFPLSRPTFWNLFVPLAGFLPVWRADRPFFGRGRLFSNFPPVLENTHGRELAQKFFLHRFSSMAGSLSKKNQFPENKLDTRKMALKIFFFGHFLTPWRRPANRALVFKFQGLEGK